MTESMIALGMRLTRLDANGTPIGEPLWLPLVRPEFSHDASSPDLSQSYPLDGLIERIDELTT